MTSEVMISEYVLLRKGRERRHTHTHTHTPAHSFNLGTRSSGIEWKSVQGALMQERGKTDILRF